MKVLLNEFIKAVEFNKICERYDSDIDIVSGRYTIDAKSIMGIFSLDLSKPLEVRINSSDENEENAFNGEMEAFGV